MTIRAMIDAARSGNAVEFEKQFVNETSARLGAALQAKRASVVADMFGLSEGEFPFQKKEKDEDDDNDDKGGDDKGEKKFPFQKKKDGDDGDKGSDEDDEE